MNSSEIRKRFLDFFQKRGHAVIPSASLVPENDSSVLFNTAGMQPLVPYLLGEKHPKGKRIADIQKCVRTNDIDEVGDNTHLTFFEMMGNWSLGDYWKEDAIKWSFELLTDKNEGFGLDPKRLYITVFGGNGDAPADLESFNIWKKYVPENRIYSLTWNGKKEPNWWDMGDSGPCGPDTEMFYDLTKEGLGDLTKEEYLQADEAQQVVEIWNDVFMEYIKKDGKVVGKLEQKNVDTGGGFERLVGVIQNKESLFDTDLFKSIMVSLDLHESLTLRQKRIIADHIRTAVFMMADGVVTSNKDRGYVLRRILRRVIFIEYRLKLSPQVFEDIIIDVIGKYSDSYPSLKENRDKIINSYFAESVKFKSTLEQGISELQKFDHIDAEGAFKLFESFGLPFEVIKEMGGEKSKKLTREEFDAEFKKHQELSRSGGEKKFKGGLSS